MKPHKEVSIINFSTMWLGPYHITSEPGNTEHQPDQHARKRASLVQARPQHAHKEYGTRGWCEIRLDCLKVLEQLTTVSL